MELHSVKNEFIFSSRNILVALGKKELLKPGFVREISEFDCSENGKILNLQHKHI